MTNTQLQLPVGRCNCGKCRRSWTAKRRICAVHGSSACAPCFWTAHQWLCEGEYNKWKGVTNR